MVEHIKSLLLRDLTTLANEITQYGKESDLWIVKPGINNCAGNLCLHLCGNLKHFIGAILGNSGYQRERDKEFSEKDLPKSDLLQNIEETKDSISLALSNLDDSILAKEYPIEMFGGKITTGFFLVHLHGHLNYHLGQVNYHRRLLASS